MRKPTIVAAALALAVVAAGCGNPTATSSNATAGDKHAIETFDKFNSESGEARTNELVKMAEDEGELNLYTSNTDIDDIIEAFSDKYDVDVNVYRANSETVLQRILQESKADYRGVDLVETNAGELNVLNAEKLLYPYESALRDQVRSEGQREGWTADRYNVFVVGWNTDLVKEGEQPTSLEDLADPKWAGKVSMEIGDVDWFAAMVQYYEDQGMSEDEAIDVFQRIAKNSKIVKGHSVQGELMSAGQFQVATSIYSHTVDGDADEGAPLEWRGNGADPVQPVVIRPNGAALMKNAQNPAAAVLFFDFLLSDAQKILHDDFRIGSIPTADDPLAGLKTIGPPEQDLLDNAEKWDHLYEEVVQGGTITESAE